jgi:hypothetical protein
MRDQDDFGPLAAEVGYRANLPLRFTRLFGREGEIAERIALVTAPEERLVTLTGPGSNHPVQSGRHFIPHSSFALFR